MKEFFDVEAVRVRLAEVDVPADVGRAYLAVLTNLNALSDLLSPHPELEDEAGQPQLERLFLSHQRRRQQLEAEYPVLATLVRPTGWQGN